MINEIPSTGGCTLSQADGVPCTQSGRSCEECPHCEEAVARAVLEAQEQMGQPSGK